MTNTKFKDIPKVDIADFSRSFAFIDFEPEKATDKELKEFIQKMENIDHIDQSVERTLKLAISVQEKRNAKKD